MGSELKSISILDVQDAVARVFHLRRSELVSRSRRQHVAYARHIAMYLSREVAGRPQGESEGKRARREASASFPRIGLAFERDHSSVIYACNVIERRRQLDQAFSRLLDSLTRDLLCPLNAAPAPALAQAWL